MNNQIEKHRVNMEESHKKVLSNGRTTMRRGLGSIPLNKQDFFLRECSDCVQRVRYMYI